MGEETGLNEKALRSELTAKIDKLELELGQLRADLHIVREIRGEIVDLPNVLRKKRDPDAA